MKWENILDKVVRSGEQKNSRAGISEESPLGDIVLVLPTDISLMTNINSSSFSDPDDARWKDFTSISKGRTTAPRHENSPECSLDPRISVVRLQCGLAAPNSFKIGA